MMTTPESSDPSYGAPTTIAEALGQVTWLLSQSPVHKELRIKDLEWAFMPALVHEQFRVFRFGPLPGGNDFHVPSPVAGGITKEGIEKMPLGIATWAKLSEAAEAKIEKGERLTLAEWNSGDRVWLLELISPFANKENKLNEVMLLDLMKGPFADTPFNLHRTDPITGRRERIKMSSHVRAARNREGVAS
jgi:cytolysin-activating lysine-acyltransferase